MSIRVSFQRYFESVHLYQLYAGFGMLAADGKIQCEYQPSPEYQLPSHGPRFLTVVLNDQIKLAYDTDDGGMVISEALDWCDVYFKRSYSQGIHAPISAKIQPLGLYYLAYGPGMGFARRLLRNPHALRDGGFARALKLLVLHNRALSAFLSLQGGSSVNWYHKFEGAARLQKEPGIVFMTQLWKPHPGADKAIIDERLEINQTRCECIRLLRKEFGGLFHGGVYPDDYALATHPQCVITDKRVFHKRNYLARMHGSDIGVATKGLFGSNGGKLSEYTAAAKAIVSEELSFQVPGEFLSGQNYLQFTTPQQCVAQVQTLVEDPDLRYEMMRRNQRYYLNHLRPDALIWNSLQYALGQRLLATNDNAYEV